MVASYQTALRQDQRTNIKNIAAAFIDQTARTPMCANVFFGVRYLALPGALDVGIARFLPAVDAARREPVLGTEFYHGCPLYCAVEATGGTDAALIGRAVQQAVPALSLLRLHLQRAFRGLHRDQVLFELDGRYLIASGDGTRRRGYQRWREPIALDLSPRTPEWATSVETEGQTIRDLPASLRERIATALEWMDVAARAPSWKTEIPAIFSGIESLLVPEDCGSKAEVVTVRSVILQCALGEGFFHPGQTYSAYLVRCELVHGSPVGADVTGELQQLGSKCELWAREIIGASIAYAAQNQAPDVTTLVGSLDRSEAAQQACQWLAEHGGSEVVGKYRKALNLLVV